MLAAGVAMIVANSPLATGYRAMLKTGLGALSVHAWIDDGLMALFFLLVGLEIKHELVSGALADPTARRLPVIAAVAGMVVPALVYLVVTGGSPALARGWAIPAATDIAFAVGVMALLGSRVPASLKLLLTTIAIVDDMGAVAIIALAYSHGLDWAALAAAAGVLAAMAALNRHGVTALTPYLAAALLLWWMVLLSGVHATVAGVATAAFVPIARDDATSPLHRLEHALSPWVAFAIVPLFGFANAGVSLAGTSLDILVEPLVLAVATGLFLGKQAGIFGGIALADRLGLARRPGGATWWQIYGIALLAGIGFTMSLFIGGLAFPGDAVVLDKVKIGVLVGSILSALAGYGVLRYAGPQRTS